MANCCSTQLSIQSEKEIKNSEEMLKWLTENASHCSDAYADYEDENLIEVSMDTRWCIPTEQLQEFCKKFEVKVRAIGQENGVGFVQVVCVDEEGKVVQDDEIGFTF